MGHVEPAVGALLGLGLGDAFGFQLEGAEDRGDAPIVTDDELRWSGRTEQTVLAGRAILAAGLDASPDALAAAFADQLRGWWHQPDEVARGLSRSTREAAAALVAGIRRAGVSSDSPDGADPAFRAVAVGLAWPPGETTERALAITAVSHRHPTALEGAVATAWLVSSLVRGRVFDTRLVQEVSAVVAAAGLGGDIAGFLDGLEAPHTDDALRDDPAIALAVWTALAAHPTPGGNAFEVAIAAGARKGRGEAVGGLVGALLGAAWGVESLPLQLLARLEGRDALVGLARSLVASAATT